MKTLINKANPQIRITAPEIEIGLTVQSGRYFRLPRLVDYFWETRWTLVEEEPTEGIKGNLEEIPSNVDLENYISNKLRELGADLINHKPYSFNRGLNVGEGNAYQDILDRLKARKEEQK